MKRPSPLPNRVDPWGRIVAVSARGYWMGNRGCIHRGHQVVRRQTTRRWIVCELVYKDWHREVMQEGKYTELFFLDEATALAAGHRPCMFCRRAAALEFLGRAGFPRVDDLDLALDRDRLGTSETITATGLPDGAMVEWHEKAWLVARDELWPWTFSGYGDPVPLPEESVRILTPNTTLRALREGYRVQTALDAPR